MWLYIVNLSTFILNSLLLFGFVFFLRLCFSTPSYWIIHDSLDISNYRFDIFGIITSEKIYTKLAN